MKSDANPHDNEPLANVDCSKTRAYGLGLNGLYLNMHARERQGIVTPGAEADALLKEIREKLLAVRDPINNLPVITRVDFAADVYQGPYVHDGLDALVCYNRVYPSGWR